MAVRVSDTKHFKKGDKLPDGTIAKRGVVWNTKTNKRVTGKVIMTNAGQGGMGATKSYKAGRAVKPKISSTKTPAAKPRGGAGGGTTGGTTKSAAEKARLRRLEQNKGVKGGTIRAGAAGRGVRKYNAKTGRWERVTGATGSMTTSSQNQNQGGTKRGVTPVSGTVAAATQKKTGSYQAGTGGGSAYEKALMKGRTRKYGADTPGNRAAAAVGSAVSNVFTARSDAQVAANNKRVAEAERKKRAAAAAALKKRREELKNRGR